MKSTDFGQDLAAASGLMRGCPTVAAAAKGWMEDAKKLGEERDRLLAAVKPFDDAMEEIFSMCLAHAPEDFEIHAVSAEKLETAEDYEVAARNAVRIVEAVIVELTKATGAKTEKALDDARLDGMREAIGAVSRTAAPVQGTPYSVGGRRFAEAIELQMLQPRNAVDNAKILKPRTT